MVGTGNGEQPLRILHVLRAPIGGLWRHVVDLTREQSLRGHAVGIITDASTGGDRAKAILEELAPQLSLGVSRISIRRNPHPSDIRALAHVTRRILETNPDVVHGHGSKGGVLARIAPRPPGSRKPVRVYTPHGGSLNYRPGGYLHALYMKVEGALRGRTDLALFESAYIASRYTTFVGRMPTLHRIVHNGISASEFEPLTPNADATDLLYVGELRAAKGIDTLLGALRHAGQFLGEAPSLTLVGSGPDRDTLEAQAVKLGVMNRVTFRDAIPARDAFRLGRLLVVPSRAESLPYVVLEAAGAAVPIVATDVGGIPEIFGPMRHHLITCDSVPALGDRIVESLTAPAERRAQEARTLADYVRNNFSLGRMVDGILAAYGDAASITSAQSTLRSHAPAPLAS